MLAVPLALLQARHARIRALLQRIQLRTRETVFLTYTHTHMYMYTYTTNKHRHTLMLAVPLALLQARHARIRALLRTIQMRTRETVLLSLRAWLTLHTHINIKRIDIP